MSDSLRSPGKKAQVHTLYFAISHLYLQRAAHYLSICSNIHTERCRESCGHPLIDV